MAQLWKMEEKVPRRKISWESIFQGGKNLGRKKELENFMPRSILSWRKYCRENFLIGGRSLRRIKCFWRKVPGVKDSGRIKYSGYLCLG